MIITPYKEFFEFKNSNQTIKLKNGQTQDQTFH